MFGSFSKVFINPSLSNSYLLHSKNNVEPFQKHRNCNCYRLETLQDDHVVNHTAADLFSFLVDTRWYWVPYPIRKVLRCKWYCWFQGLFERIQWSFILQFRRKIIPHVCCWDKETVLISFCSWSRMFKFYILIEYCDWCSLKFAKMLSRYEEASLFNIL